MPRPNTGAFTARRWCVTSFVHPEACLTELIRRLNSNAPEDTNWKRAQGIKYFVGQLEQAPTTGEFERIFFFDTPFGAPVSFPRDCKHSKIFAFFSGNLHIQAYFEFENKRGRTVLTREILAGHWEPAMGTRQENTTYCTKEGGTLTTVWPQEAPEEERSNTRMPTVDWQLAVRDLLAHNRIEDAYADQNNINLQRALRSRGTYMERVFATKSPPKAKTSVTEADLVPYQLQLIDYLKQDFQARRILWVWSEQSGTGKTTTCKYIAQKFKVFFAPVDGISNATHMYANQPVVILDVPRGFDTNTTDFASYLEKLSDQGNTSTGKYNGKVACWNCHVVIFSNQPPIHHLLPDRIVEIPASL